MKKLLLILFALVLLIVPVIVSAEFVGYSISKFSSDETGQACGVSFRTNENCSIWYDRVFFDYDSDRDFLTSLVTEDFTETVVNEVMGKDFLFYIRWKLSSEVGNNSPLYNLSSIEKFKVYCVQTNTGNITAPSNIFIDTEFNMSNYTAYNSYYFYEQVVMNNGQQFRCDFETHYKNGNYTVAVNPLIWDLMLPTYKTFFAEAQQRENIRLEYKIETLEAEITGEARNNAEYIASAVTNLVKMNFKIWVVLYWVLMIGLVIGVFALLIYILFWFYNYVKKSLK